MNNINRKKQGLLTTRSREHVVLQTGSIHVAILPPVNYFTIAYFKYIKSESNRVVKNKKTTQRQYSVHNMSIGHHTYPGPMDSMIA